MTDNLVVNGHNNKIDIHTCIANAVLTGHNNKLYNQTSSQDQDEDEQDEEHIDNLAILGHNNRIENLVLNTLNIQGHNNCFINVGVVGQVTDSGHNNKFNSCYKI
jgi:phosphohistidine phosphatase SixA